MPYTIRKQKCKKSDGGSGSYVLSYTDKKGKKHRACHNSKKRARGQIAAIEMETVSRNDKIVQEKNMKIKLSRLKALIKEEVARLLESANSDVALSVMENEDLISIADAVRGMNKKKVPPESILKYLDTAISGDVKEAIQYVLDTASPAQLKTLEFEAVFGDVDVLSDEYDKTLVKDPFDTIRVAKNRLAKNQQIQDLDILSLQLRDTHEVLKELLEDSSEEQFSKPTLPRRKGGLFNFLSR